MGEIMKCIKIDMYTKETLSKRMSVIAKEQGFDLNKSEGLIVVKTFCCPIKYEFIEIGSKPEEILNFMNDLAKEDGADLSKIVQKVFKDNVNKN